MPKGFKAGGRKAGTPNKKTAAMKEAARHALLSAGQALGDQLENLDAHTLLQIVYRNKELPLDLRLSAASTAIRYEMPAKSAMDVNVTARRAEDLTDDQLAEMIARADAKQLPRPTDEPIQLAPDCTENPPQKTKL